MPIAVLLKWSHNSFGLKYFNRTVFYKPARLKLKHNLNETQSIFYVKIVYIKTLNDEAIY